MSEHEGLDGRLPILGSRFREGIGLKVIPKGPRTLI